MSRIIGSIEKKEIRIKIYQPVPVRTMQRLAIAFINDTSFYANRSNLQENIIEITADYTKLYKVIGSLIELNKSHCYIW